MKVFPALMFATEGRRSPVSPAIDSLDILLQQGGIVLLLHLGHADLEDGLLLGRQALFHITLQTSQQEWAQHLQHTIAMTSQAAGQAMATQPSQDAARF